MTREIVVRFTKLMCTLFIGFIKTSMLVYSSYWQLSVFVAKLLHLRVSKNLARELVLRNWNQIA